MKPNRVPNDLIEAGFDAIRAWYAAHPNPNSYLDDRTQMRIVLAAVLTLHNERVEQPLRERVETAEHNLARQCDVNRDVAKQCMRAMESATIAERELAKLRDRIGKGETPDSYCPWCGMAMWLDADGLAPLHDHPVNGGRCPGIGRRPSDEWRDGEWKSVEETPWIDCGDGWKVRCPTADLSGLQGPFTGLLGPFGLHGDGNEVVADDAGEPS